MSKIAPLSGFPELLPDQRYVETEVISALVRTFELHGFAGIETRACRIFIGASDASISSVMGVTAAVAFWARDRAFAPDLEAIRIRVEDGDFLPYAAGALITE